MAKTGGTAARVEALLRPTLEGLGLSVWDVRYEKEGPEWYLRVLVDRADGEVMDTDTCETASRAIDPILDAEDPITESYYLEVGSPGLGRRLTRDEHFTAMAGEKVRAALYAAGPDGEKEPAGTLLGKEDDTVRLETEGGVLAIGVKEAKYFKLCDDEDLF